MENDRAERVPVTRLLARFRNQRAGRLLRLSLLGLILAWAAILRLDAITQRFGPVGHPAWLRAVQIHTTAPASRLRPAAFAWPRERLWPHRDGPPTLYQGDPHTYLRYAREMTSFYAAHYREPGYPFVTKVSLALLENQDVAVSFGSAFCSVMAVLGTYLLGSVAFSPWVGLGAAAGMAIDRDVIGWSAAGGRDDLFTFTTVMFVFALLRYARRPSLSNATLTGACAGAACLVRITAPSFILPGLVCGLFVTTKPWRERVRDMGLAALVTTAIVGPYVYNCWRVFGQPLYALDGPAAVYQAAEGQAPGPTAASYVRTKLIDRPYETLDTIAEGMTLYPFQNKWSGLDPWLPGLGRVLSWAALSGLFLFPGCRTGRVLLVVLMGSLVPYSVTWKLSSEWRLTEVAYPFFLIAAFFAVAWLAGWASPARIRDVRTISGARWRRLAAGWGLVLAAVATGWYAVAIALPARAVEEQLAAGEDVTVATGRRDAAFFRDGWSVPRGTGTVTFRDALGSQAVVWLRLPPREYSMTVRLNPFPPPAGEVASGLPDVFVLVNRNLVGRFSLGWNPNRVGAYDFRVPRAFVSEGVDRLEIVAMPPDGDQTTPSGRRQPATFSLWYVRIRPEPPR
jgi:hypothetical protein